MRFAAMLLLPISTNGTAESSLQNTGWVGTMVLDRPDADECLTKSTVGDSLYVEYEVLIDDRPQGRKRLEFTLGKAPVVGWDENLSDMCVDEERELTIPPATHKHQNIGMKDDVPRDAVLHFHVKLLDINGAERKSAYARSKARDERAKQRQRAVPSTRMSEGGGEL